MANYYFDSSVIVKRYVNEPGSVWTRQLCDARDAATAHKSNLIMIGEIAIVEVSAAFAILVRRNVIPKRIGERAYRQFVQSFQDEYELVNITPQSITTAAELAQRHPLKAYDALQLACTLRAHTLLAAKNLPMIFVSGDNQLLQAARAEGLASDNPFAHTDLDSPSRIS